MTLAKMTLTFNKKISRTCDFIARLTYIKIDGEDKFNEINKKVAENLHSECEVHADSFARDGDGVVVALLEPTVTYLDEDIISAKYDFTITEKGVLLYHRRFCMSYLIKHELVLLPRFVRGLGHVAAEKFYLIRLDGGIGATRLKSEQMQTGFKLARRGMIDDALDREPIPVKIKLPHCLNLIKKQK